MTDFTHTINPEDPFNCSECGVDIPVDVALLGDDVVELGGAAVHWLPAFAYDGKARRCVRKTSSEGVVVCIGCDGEGCADCNYNGILGADGSQLTATQAQPEGGEVIELFGPKTEFEKQAIRQSLQNFVNMREVTRPDGVEG